MKKLLLTLILFSFFVSCKKTDSSSQTQKKQLLSSNYIAYPTNPYDSVGLIHNLCLEQERLLKGLYPNITMHEFYDSLDVWMSDNFNHNYEVHISYETFIDSFHSFFEESSGQYYTDLDAIIAAWYDREILTFEEQNYIVSGLDIVKMDSTVEFTNTGINALETEVIGNNSLSAIEKRMILSYFATLRYSYEYWYNNQEDEWAYFQPQKDIFSLTGKCKAGCKWCVAGADALGIVIGGVLTEYNGNAMILGGAIASVWARCCGLCGRCDNFNCTKNSRKFNSNNYLKI